MALIYIPQGQHDELKKIGALPIGAVPVPEAQPIQPQQPIQQPEALTGMGSPELTERIAQRPVAQVQTAQPIQQPVQQPIQQPVQQQTQAVQQPAQSKVQTRQPINPTPINLPFLHRFSKRRVFRGGVRVR